MALIYGYVVQIPMEERTIPFLFSFSLMIGGLTVGAIIFVSAALRSQKTRLAPPPNILEALQQIEPEKTFEGKKCTVVKKGDVYYSTRTPGT